MLNESTQNENGFEENFDVISQKLLESDYSCSKCGHSFSKREDLLKHTENVHESKKPHKCNFCDARFYQSFGLRKHIRSTHKEKKRLKKSIKSKNYEKKKTLNKSSEAPKYQMENGKFKCPCGSLFSSEKTFRRHFAFVHEGKMSHQCTMCDAKYSTEAYLKVWWF